MHQFSLLVLLVILVQNGFSQPGPDVIFPRNINLNGYPEFPRQVDSDGMFVDVLIPLGTVTIDSTSDLSIIPQLRRENEISLNIQLDFIPKEFEGFSKTTDLSIILYTKSITDISFLNEFPILKRLNFQTDNDIQFREFLMLDSLQILEIWRCEKMRSLKAFEKLISLKSISLRRVPLLKEFPKFELSNQIVSVEIIKEMLNGCENCPANENKLDISNLCRLEHLQELHLMNFNHLHEFPDYLSNELKYLRLTGMYTRFNEEGFGFKLESVKSLARYTNLEKLEMRCLGLPEGAEEFLEGLGLKALKIADAYFLSSSIKSSK